MRVISKDQVTVPPDIRIQAGLLPNTEVDFVFDRTGQRLVDHLQGRGEGTMTTDQIMALTRGD